MKTVIVFNHPYDGSYCNSILNAVTKGLQKAQQGIDLIHLDKDGFNPVMTAEDLLAFRKKTPIDPKVLEYRDRLSQADNLILIFPIWWEFMPALTKGFIDRVVFPGVFYDYTQNGIGMVPLFKNLKSITVISTMNTPGILYRLQFGNAIGKALLAGTFRKMGYKAKWINLSMVKFVSKGKRQKWLFQLEKRFTSLHVRGGGSGR